MAFALTQRAFRFYADGTEAGSVASAAENTNVIVTDTADVNILLRIGLQESGSGSFAGAATDDFQLQYSKNGGAFANVNGVSTNVKGFNSANLTDGNATTNRLSVGTGSFVAGKIAEDGLLDNLQVTANNFTEFLYPLTFIGADVANGDTFDFRVLLNGAVITYSVTPRVTTSSIINTTIAAAQGSYALTGQAAVPHYGRKIVAAQGAYTLTGQGNYMLGSKEQGELITQNGDFITTEAGDRIVTEGFIAPLVAGFGQYTLTGQPATLKRALGLTAAQGAYVLSGQAVTPHYGRILPALQGAYVLTGQAVAFKRAYALPAVRGLYTLTGQPAVLKRALAIGAAQGAYVLTGQPAALVRAIKLTAAFGTYALSGQAVAFKSVHAMLAAQGSYTVAGQPVAFKRAYTIAANSGTYTLTGRAINLTAQRLLSATRGIYTLTGQAASFAKASTGGLAADTGLYAVTGQSAALAPTHRYTLSAATGLYTLTGYAATFTHVTPPTEEPVSPMPHGGIGRARGRRQQPVDEPRLDFARIFREEDEMLAALTAFLTLRGKHENTHL